MKNLRNLVLVLLIVVSQYSWSQSYINIMGNCDTSDVTLHYDNFAFISGDQADSLKYTHVFSFYCNSTVDDITDYNIQKEFFAPFHFVKYDSIYYPLSGLQIHLLFKNRDSLNGKNEFLVELRVPGLNQAIAYIYGSNNLVFNPEGFKVTLSYLISLDTKDDFASNYLQQELSYKQIFSNSISYLKEIRDIDRNNQLVGFEYLSPSTNLVHTKFITANN
ncbi:MAG TPA: hypothetical protein PLE30_00470 [Candidatus Kapabacteria bacterium]|nr:hypothetical protein [Candidatus Kapabacteria bacterium]